MSFTVSDEGDRFQIAVDGQVAGFTQYQDRDGVRIFPHTEIDPAYQGQGLASKLIAQALDATREKGLSALPLCPAVARYIAKHPEYADLVPEDQRERFGIS